MNAGCVIVSDGSRIEITGSNFGSPQAARVKDRLNCPVLFVPGNHDLSDPPADVVGSNADGRIVEQAGLRIAGFGGAGPKAFGFPYEWTEPEAGASLDKLLSGRQGEIDIFLCHTPPLDTKLDLTDSGEHVGSSAVAAWIERVRPTFFVCGHIHEAWGVERFGRTPCLNAGALGEPHGQEIVWIVEWRDGPIRVECRRRSPEGAVAQRRRRNIGTSYPY